jgi:Fe-S-cluster-containing dehydrogenase component
VIRRAGFVVDLGRCVGCAACVLACRLENGWPSSAPWRRVLPLNEVRHPGGPTYFLSVACHHCEHPACVDACPSGAYERRSDGVVVHHEALCLGCRYCEMACPFGAPQFDTARGVMTKCDFCQGRNAVSEQPASGASAEIQGEGARHAVPLHGGGYDEPACVVACPTEALRAAPARQAGGSADADATAVSTVPGFVDAAACRPAIRFTLPHGMRGRRLEQLLKKMGPERR